MAQASSLEQAAGNRLVVEDSIDVKAPISEVYHRWVDFTRFPEFMDNVEDVRPIGGNRYHWVARMFGTKQEWDTQITEQEPERRISWRSVNGTYNAGTVGFSSLPEGKTEVRLRMEYTPPAGKVGVALDQVTQSTRREVRKNLENFKQLMMGRRAVVPEAGKPVGFGRVMASLAVPVAAGIAGGLTEYAIERNVRKARPLRRLTSPVEPSASAAGWLFTAAAAGSVIGSATLRGRGDRSNALFVGQWAPTLLQMGILSRLAGHRGVEASPTTSATSWGLMAASLGSIITSAALHSSGKRNDGLFVGQWAPTFLGLSLLTRLIARQRC